MGMPNEFPFEPLPSISLITKLDTNFKDIAIDMFHPPFSQSDPLPTSFHGADMILHGLCDRWISNGRVMLYQGQGFSFLWVPRRSHRGQRRPSIVEGTDEDDTAHHVVNDATSDWAWERLVFGHAGSAGATSK